MDHISELRKHLIYPSWEEPDYYLRVKVDDVLCQAEHDMTGSTTTFVDFPWIPYAILAGKSVAEVNVIRAEMEDFPVIPSCFGFPNNNYIIFCKHNPVNLTALVVPEPKIVNVITNDVGRLVDKSIWEGRTYTGPYHNVRQVITLRN